MPPRQSGTLTEAELRIMDVLWLKGSGTVQQVLDSITQKPALAYNSVLTTIRVLEKKGYLKHLKDGRAHVYTPLVGQKDATRSEIRHLVSRFFKNSHEQLVLNLLEDQGIGPEEIGRLREMLVQNDQRHGSADTIRRTRNELASPAVGGADFGRAYSQRASRRIPDRTLCLGAAARLAQAKFGNPICRLVSGIADRCCASGVGGFGAGRTTVPMAGMSWGKPAARDYCSRVLGAFRFPCLGCRGKRGDGTFGFWALVLATIAPELHCNRSPRILTRWCEKRWTQSARQGR